MEAYVLVQIDMQGDPIAEALRAIPGVENAEDLSGPYDATRSRATIRSPGRSKRSSTKS